MNKPFDLTASGAFLVGCNYWASHAGTAMWSDWRPDVVGKDLKALSKAGLQVLRVFPLWPDLQPVTLLRTGGGAPAEYRHGEQPLGTDPIGSAGLSAVMLDRFEEFARLAAKHDLKLIVGLITGWMSGRLFVPPALEGLNVLTDPAAIRWQVRFVRAFVRRFRNAPSIIAWDLGNECNCMASAGRNQAWLWTWSVTQAIRCEDPSRPVVSGMHSLSPHDAGPWTIQDQAELTDLLTTHPYPYFTPHCDHDPLPTLRTCLHAAAESRMYADIGGKPCLAEELGTLGAMFASDSIAADFVRTNLFSLWANDVRGLLWWCANDQTRLAHAPYDWHAVERELGLLREDGSPKPVLAEFTRFRKFLDKLPVRRLPPRLTDGVCILSVGQEAWATAYIGFILAKQAGFDIEFQYANQPLKDAPLYLLPSLTGGQSLTRRAWLALLARVKAGATLYLSLDSALISGFEEITGLEVQTRSRRASRPEVHFEGAGSPFDLVLPAAFRLDAAPTRAQVLGREADGNPVFTRADYGRGKVYFLACSMESALAGMPGVFHVNPAPYWRIYEQFSESRRSLRAVRKNVPHVGITEHPLNGNRRLVVAINYSPAQTDVCLSLSRGWKLEKVFRGQTPDRAPDSIGLALPANDAGVFTIARK